MLKRRSADLTTRRAPACLNWLAKWNGSQGKESFTSGTHLPRLHRDDTGKRNSFRPRCCPHGFRNDSVDIAFRFIPFSDVGGDFVDFFRLPDGPIGIYLGDVVGKGLSAAMFAALVMGTLRGIHKSGTDTARVLSC
jgi:hypothetical protein